MSENNLENLKLEFLDNVKRHDFAYDYSDDHRVFMAGSRTSGIIHDQAKQLLELGANRGQLLKETLGVIRKGDKLAKEAVEYMFREPVKADA